jgi:hypothetical protein
MQSVRDANAKATKDAKSARFFEEEDGKHINLLDQTFTSFSFFAFLRSLRMRDVPSVFPQVLLAAGQARNGPGREKAQHIEQARHNAGKNFALLPLDAANELRHDEIRIIRHAVRQ